MRRANEMPVQDLLKIETPYTETAKALKTFITSPGDQGLRALKNKLDIYLLYDRISLSEYKELYEMVVQKQRQNTTCLNE